MKEDNFHNDRQVLKTISLDAGNNPWYMAFVGRNKAYVTNLKDNSVSVVDVETGTVLKNITVGTGPEGILVSGNKAFIANTGYAGWGQPYEQATVSIIDVLVDSVTHTLEVPTNAQDVALDPNGRIHVVCAGNYADIPGKIAVIDLYTGPYWDTPAVVDTIEIGSTPGDIVITPSGKGYCVAWGNGTNGFLYSYDALADTVIHGADSPILIGPNVMRVLYDGKENVLWIPYMTEWGGDGFAQKFDVESDSVIWTSGVLGNGTMALAILEPILDSDPWADVVESFTPGAGTGFGQNYFPGNVLGPPDPDPGISPNNPSSKPQELLSLGHSGEIILQFTDNKIFNGDGVDFTVFENAFISWDGSVFMEAGIVSVSQDGENWYQFPYDTTDMSGLAGVTPTDDNQNPTDPAVSGGDQFDLADLGLEWASYVKITDLGDIYQEGQWNGDFDLDAVVAVNSQVTSVDKYVEAAQPVQFTLHQNYPNPFNPETIIKFSTDEVGLIELKVFNTLGQEIKTLINEVKNKGTYQVVWNGKDNAEKSVVSGLYFYQLKSGNLNQIRKMTLIR